MDDRRSKPRLSVRLDAMWDSSTQAHSARVTDLSEGGCFLDSVGEVRRGEIVGFRVLMPDDDWLYLEGEVKHHSMKGFGVQFTELNEDQTEKLQWLLRIAQEAGPDDAPISADLEPLLHEAVGDEVPAEQCDSRIGPELPGVLTERTL